MKNKIVALLLILVSSANVCAKDFHCRITHVVDYHTNQIVDSKPLNEEFFAESDWDSDMYYSANVVMYLPSYYKGSLVKGENRRLKPNAAISKLDHKFFDMYLYKQPMGHKERDFKVSGFCKEI